MSIYRKVIKAYSYTPVSSEPFDIPVPLRLELLHLDTLLCIYSIAGDFTVDFSYNTNTEIPMLTPTDRSMTINDIYYLIRSRIFPDNPFTSPAQLSQLGLKEYDPFAILMKTHGILPMNPYWIRRAGDAVTFEEALNSFNELMYGAKPAPKQDGGIEDFLGM